MPATLNTHMNHKRKHFLFEETHVKRNEKMILLTLFPQKWLNALKDHITYSTHYMHQGVTGSDEEEILPLGSLQDTLKVSTPPYIMSHS